MAKYNLTTDDYENLAADAKASLLRYIEGEGDSDQYDSEGEEEIVKTLSEDEKKMYDEYRDVYIKQLVEMGRVADLSIEIRRHMFKWLPGIPEEYTTIASKAVKKAREEKKKKIIVEKKIKKTAEADVLEIKFIRGDPKLIKEQTIVKTEVKDEPMEEPMQLTQETRPVQVEEVSYLEIDLNSDEDEDEELEIEEIEEGAEVKIEADPTVKKPEVIEALKELEEGCKRQALAYEKLRKTVPALEAKEVKSMIEELPTTPVYSHLSDSVKDFLEREEDQTVRMCIGVGLFYLEQHLCEKQRLKKKKYPAPEKTKISQRFGLEYRKFIEVSQGTAYAGGSSKK